MTPRAEAKPTKKRTKPPAPQPWKDNLLDESAHRLRTGKWQAAARLTKSPSSDSRAEAITPDAAPLSTSAYSHYAIFAIRQRNR